MKGFTDKALILFPKMESYAQRGYEYRHSFKTAVDSLYSYLQQCGIKPHVFYTDDVARLYKDGAELVSTLDKSDLFFTSRNCEGMHDAMQSQLITFDDVYSSALKKYKIDSTMSVEQRFNEVVKRSTYATKEIIKRYQLICHFVRKGNPNYKVQSKVGDGKVLIEIDCTSFIPTVYMSGKTVNPCSILDLPYGNRSLLIWRDLQCQQ